MHIKGKGWDMEGSLGDISGGGRAPVIPIDMIDMVSKKATISLGGDGEKEDNECTDMYFKLCVRRYSILLCYTR